MEEGRKYIDEFGFDYTPYIRNDEDVKEFERMVELHKQCHKPLKECVHQVAEAMNLDRKLRFGNHGKSYAKVTVQSDPRLN